METTQKTFGINLNDIVFKYEKIRPIVKEMIYKNDKDDLKHLITSFTTYLKTFMPNYDEKGKNNIILFFLDMPIEIMTIYVDIIDSYGRKSPEFSICNDSSSCINGR